MKEIKSPEQFISEFKEVITPFCKSGNGCYDTGKDHEGSCVTDCLTLDQQKKWLRESIAALVRWTVGFKMPLRTEMPTIRYKLAMQEIMKHFPWDEDGYVKFQIEGKDMCETMRRSDLFGVLCLQEDEAIQDARIALLKFADEIESV